MLEKLKEIEKKYNMLSEELMKPEVINDFKQVKKISKERSNLEEIINSYIKYKTKIQSISETKELLKDEEIREIAAEELKQLESEKEELEVALELLLVPKDDNDTKNIILEIRGAAGGNEANIFAGDLYEMYLKYISNMGWDYEVINSIPGVAGGYSQIELIVRGKNVYSQLKYESGSHRVQRVPTTESQGRVHTSTATVIVMPEEKNIKIEVKENDIKVDVYRSGGAGGQSVNTTDSAVRLTHIPSGIVVTCQNERSQLKNKERALQILKNKIHEEEIRKQEEKIGKSRRQKIGTGDRSEKIRTYNYAQNRITDHRINFTTMNLDKVMEGRMEEIIEALTTEDQRRKLEESQDEI